jgi:hypothetical protein
VGITQSGKINKWDYSNVNIISWLASDKIVLSRVEFLIKENPNYFLNS